MKSKKSARYVCQNCGAVSGVWSGKCNSCGEWNTIIQEAELVTGASSATTVGKKLSSINIKQASESNNTKRIKSNIGDVDMILGGGIVPGSLVLVAGQPGIGKSTLLMQIASNIALTNSVLYVSGEESAHQVATRANRLNVKSKNLEIASSNSAEDIAMTVQKQPFDVVVVDSIQTMSVSGVSSSAGSVSQITNSTHLLMAVAKATNTAIVLVGHVTKEGSIAGPKVLEHIVDVVLNFEGDRYGGFKVLRSIKNRYGSANEAGIFEMSEVGLTQVKNPSASLLAERQDSDGSVVLATMEGTRPLLVEVQALVNRTSYGYPKRAASGIDLNRLNLLIAMLEKRTKLRLGEHDIYINIIGGIKVNEPAADLAICMAIGSAAKGLMLKGNAVVFGEVGLSGEIRRVNFTQKRIAEAKKLGFDTIIGPSGEKWKEKSYFPVKSVKDALNNYLKSK